MRRFQSVKAMGLVTLLGALGLGVLVALAQPGDSTDSSYPSVKTAGPVSRVFQQVTGFTPISGWVANRVLHRELSRYLKGHLHSRLILFSGSDLIAGKAKGVEISGKNLMLNGFIPLSDFTFSSQQDMPIFVSDNKRPVLLRPVTFHMTMSLSEQDVNHMLNSDMGHKMLTDMRVKLPPFGYQSFDAANTAVHFDSPNNRVSISTLMNLHGAPTANALPMTVSGTLTPDKSSLALSDLDLKIEGINNTQDMAQVVEHYFNDVVNLGHIKVQRHKLKAQVEESSISNGLLHIKASMTVSPDPKALKAALAKSAN